MRFSPNWTQEESSIPTGLSSTFQFLRWGPIWTEKDPKTGMEYTMAVSDLPFHKNLIFSPQSPPSPPLSPDQTPAPFQRVFPAQNRRILEQFIPKTYSHGQFL